MNLDIHLFGYFSVSVVFVQQVTSRFSIEFFKYFIMIIFFLIFYLTFYSIVTNIVRVCQCRNRGYQKSAKFSDTCNQYVEKNSKLCFSSFSFFPIFNDFKSNELNQIFLNLGMKKVLFNLSSKFNPYLYNNAGTYL